MMRRGPTDQYPIESILHEAAADEVSGSIELNTEPPGTFYLDHGRVYFAVPAVVPGMHEPVPASSPRGDAELRARVVQILIGTWGPRPGYYFHDPLAHQIDGQKASWSVDELLAEARHLMNQRDIGRRWDRVTVAARPPANPDAQLNGDCWDLIVAMTDPRSTNELAHRLGWDVPRLGAALETLTQHGAIATNQPVAQPTRQPAVRQAPVPPHHAGPQTAPPRAVQPQQPQSQPPAAPQWNQPVHPGAALAAQPSAPSTPERNPSESRQGALRRLIGSLRAT